MTFARRSLAVLAAMVAAVWLDGCGVQAAGTITVADHPAQGRYEAAAILTPSRPAPDFTLTDQSGHRVRLARFRGRAVVLTFIYVRCPDGCPLIVAKLRQALTLLGREARRVAIVGVSVDPRGDTPRTVTAFLRTHGMSRRMAYLTGSRTQLESVWRAYAVAVAQPRPGSTVVGHSAVLYGITGSGREETVYSADSFEPAAIAHDVPLLAASR